MKIAERMQGKRILLWGYGKEGRSTERFLQEHCRPDTLQVYEGPQSGIDESAWDYIIKSPGIAAESYGARYTAATDLFLEEFSAQTIGITGTKGKSTTTTMLYQVLSQCQNRPVLLVGNIGVPCLDLYDQITADTIIVFELSCHQLEHAVFSPHIALFLNLYEDHLDRYKEMAPYFLAKSNITAHQTPDDWFYVSDQVPPLQTKAHTVVLPDTDPLTFSMQLQGEHNQKNARFVYAVATQRFGCEENAVRRAIAACTGLSHRLEYIGTYEDIAYYDDSISTIPEATIAAIRSIPNTGTVLIGGMDRHIEYDVLIRFIREHGEYTYILMYASGERIYREVSDLACCHYCDTLEDAVVLAKKVTRKQTACILSPAAASYGYFTNFEERGDVFRKLVHSS